MSGDAQRPGLGQLLSALTPPLPPPTLEQEIRRLIATHGADAVKSELRLATKKPLGRKPESDWPLLAADITQDARDWLEGRDYTLRSNYSIARRVAEERPGHSAPATMLRIQRKLAKERRKFMLFMALQLSQNEYPFAQYFRTVDALATLFEEAAAKAKGKVGQKAFEWSDRWRRMLALDREKLARYVELHGDPDPAMTWAQIEATPLYPVNSLGRLLDVSSRPGMFAAPPPKSA